MADFLILDDANAKGPAGIELLKAGRVVSDADFDIASLKQQGVAVMPFDPTTMGPLREIYLRTNASTRAKNRTAASLSALLLADGVIGSPVFAPTIVVGNVPAGDPATGQSAPFQYIGDPGDGSGIAAAFAAMAAGGIGGSVYIRRGLYDFGLADSPSLPLTIAGFNVTGDGGSTQLRMSTLDRRLFLMTNVSGRVPRLESVGIDWTLAAPGASGTEMVGASGSVRALFRNVEVVKSSGGSVANADESLTSVLQGGVGTLFNNCRLLGIDSLPGAAPGGGVACFRLASVIGAVDNCTTSGGNLGVVIAGSGCHVTDSTFGSTAATNAILISVLAADARVINNRFSSGEDGIVIGATGSGIVSLNVLIASALAGDGIRVDLGALNCIVSSNRLNGNVFNDLDPSTVVGLNAP